MIQVGHLVTVHGLTNLSPSRHSRKLSLLKFLLFMFSEVFPMTDTTSYFTGRSILLDLFCQPFLTLTPSYCVLISRFFCLLTSYQHICSVLSFYSFLIHLSVTESVLPSFRRVELLFENKNFSFCMKAKNVAVNIDLKIRRE